MVKKLFLLFAFALFAVPVVCLAGVKAPDVLDTESVKMEKPLAKGAVIGVRQFSIDDVEYDNVDDEEMRKMKREIKDYQAKLARELRRDLEDYEIKAVLLEESSTGDADVVVEGKITGVNLGNAVARFGFGWGAGQCGIDVEGKLVDARTGETLATFEHGSSSGLDSGFDKWQMVEKEVGEMAEDIAEFVDKLRE